MHMDDSNQQIRHYSLLLKKRFDGILASDERRELARWLWEERQNRELYRHTKSAYSLKSYYEAWEKIDPAKEYKLLTARCPELRERRWRLAGTLRWAAAVLVLLLGGTLWFHYGNIGKISDVTVLPQDDKVIAVLKTSEGTVFRLKGDNTAVGAEQVAGLQIRDSLKELICEQIPVTDSLAMHELAIPRGGEYKLILSDGTKVWLNSESAIRFPAVFAGNHREITLYGEAYLEVSHDAARPFRVKAGEGVIEVLGTSFGMYVYPEEHRWSTMLVNGSVKVRYGQNSLLLEPGKEAVVQDGKLIKQVCDTDKELAWVKGLFIFEHDRLEEVVKKLSRWYDVEFGFEDKKLKDYVFTGRVSRDLGVDNILDMMERMNVVSFEKTNGYVLIKEKAGKF